MRRLTPYLLLAVLMLGTGAAAGLGLSGAPSRSGPGPQSARDLPTATVSTQPPARFYLQSFAFLNPNAGYGVFLKTGPRTNACEYLIGRTDDGGARFSSLESVTSWSCNNAQPLASSLAFDAHGDGFFFDPALFVTHNGGRSWMRDHQPETVLSVQARGDSVWMLEADCPRSGQTALCPLSLLESDDGGVSWYPPLSPPPASAFRGTQFPGQSWLVRTGQSSAYVVSVPPDGVGHSDNTFAFWFTANGGATWDPGQIPCGILAYSVALAAAPDGPLMAICAGGPAVGSQAKAVSRSEDGGANWVVYPGCNWQDQNCGNSPPTAIDSGYLGTTSVGGVSATTTFLQSGNVFLLVTHDGGADWQPVGANVGDGDSGPSQVSFFNPSDGLVLGNGTLWKTSDGGIDWSSVVPEP